MTMMVSLEKAKQDLDKLLVQLPLGETLTLVDANGAPTAVVVSLKEYEPTKAETLTPDAWGAAWNAFVKEVDEAWLGEESMVNTLLEMRR